MGCNRVGCPWLLLGPQSYPARLEMWLSLCTSLSAATSRELWTQITPPGGRGDAPLWEKGPIAWVTQHRVNMNNTVVTPLLNGVILAGSSGDWLQQDLREGPSAHYVNILIGLVGAPLICECFLEKSLNCVVYKHGEQLPKSFHHLNVIFV